MPSLAPVLRTFMSSLKRWRVGLPAQRNSTAGDELSRYCEYFASRQTVQPTLAIPLTTTGPLVGSTEKDGRVTSLLCSKGAGLAERALARHPRVMQETRYSVERPALLCAFGASSRHQRHGSEQGERLIAD
jgi:hypothetical protein